MLQNWFCNTSTLFSTSCQSFVSVYFQIKFAQTFLFYVGVAFERFNMCEIDFALNQNKKIHLFGRTFKIECENGSKSCWREEEKRSWVWWVETTKWTLWWMNVKMKMLWKYLIRTVWIQKGGVELLAWENFLAFLFFFVLDEGNNLTSRCRCCLFSFPLSIESILTYLLT